MKYIILFFTFYTQLSFSYCQSSLSGVVKDSKNQPISFVNIVMYDLNDYYIDMKTTDDEGKFLFNFIESNNVYIQASFIGYGNYTSEDIVLDDSAKNLTIVLQQDENLMETIEIVGKKPLLEQKSDRMIVNVADNITSLNTSLQDVMKKIPGVLIVNDRLSLAGQSNITILINGRSTKYMDMESLLQDMPGDNIQKVEVITNPGAEFQASGTGPVINIILKKNVLQGTRGSVRSGIAHTDDFGFSSGLSLSHLTKGLSIQGNLGYSLSNWREDFHIIRTINYNDQVSIYNQSTDDYWERESFRSGASIDYTINDKQNIGLNSRYVSGTRDGSKSAVTTVTVDLDANQVLSSSNLSVRDYSYVSLTPYYTYKIDTMGQKITLDCEYINYDVESNSTLNNDADIGNIPIDQYYEQPGVSKLWTAQLDYTKSLNESIKLKSGLRYSLSDLDNNNVRYDIINEDKIINNLQSNHYLFEETVNAAYVKSDIELGAYMVSAGLRYEQSKSKGKSVSLDSTLSRDISKLFPSAGITGPVIGDLGWAADYSYRIERPSFWSLNPFVYYYDPYTYEKGNPNILPETTHSGKFSITYDKQPFLQFQYSFTDDAMVSITEQDDATGEAARLTVNLAERIRYGVNLYFPLDMLSGGYVDGYGGLMYYHKKYTGNVQDNLFNQDADAIDVFIQGSFTLPWNVKAELNAWYTSGGLDDILRYEWMYGTSLGLSKSFLKKSLKVSLGIEDPVNKFFSGEVHHANQDISVDNSWSHKNVTMQIQYKFGNQYTKDKKLDRNIDSEGSRLSRD